MINKINIDFLLNKIKFKEEVQDQSFLDQLMVDSLKLGMQIKDSVNQ